MAERAKAKKAAVSAGSASRMRKAKADGASAETRPKGKGAGTSDIDRLRAECAALKVELSAAREEIARLERRQELVVNRIDWVIDSLHNLLEGEE